MSRRREGSTAPWLFLVPFLVNVQAGDTPRTRIQVFVTAPHCPVDVPFVERQRDVSDRVGKVPPTYTILCGADQQQK